MNEPLSEADFIRAALVIPLLMALVFIAAVAWDRFWAEEMDEEDNG